MATKPDMTDTDGDGLPDIFEREIGTDPRDKDTDGDHLDDGMEVHLTTDPLRPDTDGDHLTDWAEVQLGTDPELRDTDGDGRHDGTEVLWGTNPKVGEPLSDDDRLVIEELQKPLSVDKDADRDGVPDTVEHDIGTDDLDMDSDGDGLGDWIELSQQSYSSTDNDGDGTSDLDEIELGTPLDLRSDAAAAEPGAVEMPEIEMPAEYVGAGAVEMPDVTAVADAATESYEADDASYEPEVALDEVDTTGDDFTDVA